MTAYAGDIMVTSFDKIDEDASIEQAIQMISNGFNIQMSWRTILFQGYQQDRASNQIRHALIGSVC